MTAFLKNKIENKSVIDPFTQEKIPLWQNLIKIILDLQDGEEYSQNDKNNNDNSKSIMAITKCNKIKQVL